MRRNGGRGLIRAIAFLVAICHFPGSEQSLDPCRQPQYDHEIRRPSAGGTRRVADSGRNRATAHRDWRPATGYRQLVVAEGTLMKVYDAASLRNVALVGHSGSGKTQLVSALLYDAGAVNRLGKVDDGTTVTDYDDEEIARKHTLSASVAYAEWNKTKINFIDTPGMANFLSDARAALRVADAALVVVDALHGVEVSTEKVWETADELATPRIIALNRLDRERASLDRSLQSLRGVFGRTVIPIQLPIGEERHFKGVVDLIAMKACVFATDGSGKPVDGAI